MQKHLTSQYRWWYQIKLAVGLRGHINLSVALTNKAI